MITKPFSQIVRSIGRSHNLFYQEENTSLKLPLGKECVEDQLVEGLKLIVPRSFVLMSDIGSLQSFFCRLQQRNSIYKFVSPAYDVKFYSEDEDALVCSCGDDGKVQGWKWLQFSDYTENNGKPVLELTLVH
ncbi:hypothetical protein Bca4012_065754 [Brassica carinata]